MRLVQECQRGLLEVLSFFLQRPPLPSFLQVGVVEVALMVLRLCVFVDLQSLLKWPLRPHA